MYLTFKKKRTYFDRYLLIVYILIYYSPCVEQKTKEYDPQAKRHKKLLTAHKHKQAQLLKNK